MKLGWKIFIIIFALVGLSFLGHQLASAQNFKTGNNITVPTNETIDGTLFAAGRDVDVAGEVNGDVFCAGQNVTVSGTVHGDVICAGQTVHVSGKIDGDVRLAGQTVNLSGSVGHNATIGTQSFTLEQTAKIGGDASVAAANMAVNGPIGRDLFGSAGTIEISSVIGRNVKVNVENLTFNSSAKVDGKVSYRSNNDANVEQGAQVTSIERSTPLPTRHDNLQIFRFAIFITFLMVTALFIVSIVLAALFPQVFISSADKALAKPWWVLLTGFIAVISAPIIFIVLMITVVGIPLAIIFGLAWLTVLLLAGPFFSFWLGRLIWRDGKNVILVMLLGVAIVMISYMIPIIGLIMALAILFMGTGIILHELQSHLRKPHYNIATVNRTKKAN